MDLVGDAGGEYPQFGQALFVRDAYGLAKVAHRFDDVARPPGSGVKLDNHGVDFRRELAAIGTLVMVHELHRRAAGFEFGERTDHHGRHAGRRPAVAAVVTGPSDDLVNRPADLFAECAVGEHHLHVVDTNDAYAVRQAVNNVLQVGFMGAYACHLHLKPLRHAVEATAESGKFIVALQMHALAEPSLLKGCAGRAECGDRLKHTATE